MGNHAFECNKNQKSKKCYTLSSESDELLKNLSKKLEQVFEIVIKNEIKTLLSDAGVKEEYLVFALKFINNEMEEGKDYKDAVKEYLKYKKICLEG